MKKQINLATEVESSLSERLNEHPVLTWISQNSKNFLYIIIIVVCVGILAYRLLSYWSSQAGYNYVVAENDYVELHALKGDEREATAQQLMGILNQQPDLQAVYDGKLAQLFLTQGDIENAELLMIRALARTAEENSPLFDRYAETTLLIAKEDYPLALSQAQELNQYILDNPEQAGSNLLPINMLRIAMLQKKLGMTQEEGLTWQDWKEYVAGEKDQGASVAGFQQVATTFREGKINLTQYIESREKALK